MVDNELDYISRSHGGQYQEPETERLARDLARRTGLSMTEAITVALREQLTRETGRRGAPRIRDELLAIGRRCAALPDLDTRSADEILGYDELGRPR